MTQALIQVRDLHKEFKLRSAWLGGRRQVVRAVNGVSFDIHPGEALGIVGESGCGKSTLGRCLLRLIEPTSGQIFYRGENLLGLDGRQMRLMRRELQIIFQDPYASLNPRMKVGRIVGEGIEVHGLAKGKQKRALVEEILRRVGLPTDAYDRYPHEFSGGQRQRIGIARALAVQPKFVVADEPVSALDVSIQAQVINLLQDLQEEFGLAYLFIAHDLRVVEHISHRVAIMYLGKIVEIASREELYGNPLHPYTRALLSAIPQPDPGAKSRRIRLLGDPPAPTAPPAGCAFHPRCEYAEERCRVEIPELLEGGSGHAVACHVFPARRKEAEG